MSRPLAVLRPEPGNTATAAAVEAAGLVAIRMPLFTVVPLAWHPADPSDHDALLFTSANAVRQAGPALARYAALPVLAVGAATARAAEAAGFTVAVTGTAGAAALLAQPHPFTRVLHLAGRERSVDVGGAVTRVAAVYANEVLPLPDAVVEQLTGSVALLHSARAARRLAVLASAALRVGAIRLAALSAPVATAAGAGWARVAVAARPTDAALIAAARGLAD